MAKSSRTGNNGLRVVRPELLVGIVFFGVAAAMSVWGASNVPAGALIPIQWSGRGVSNAVPKTLGLFLVPGIVLALILLAWVLPKISARREHLAQSSKAYNLIFIALFGFLALAHSVSILSAAGRNLPTERIVLLAAALLFIVVGNYVSKVRSNFFVGIRTPWTLSSESTWKKTHRLGAVLFVLVGVVSFFVGLFTSVQVLGTILVAGLLVAAGVSVVYSFLAWRNASDRNDRNHDQTD